MCGASCCSWARRTIAASAVRKCWSPALPGTPLSSSCRIWWGAPPGSPHTKRARTTRRSGSRSSLPSASPPARAGMARSSRSRRRCPRIFKSAQRFRYAYRFEVENHLQRPEQIELAEQVPVSELSDVEVALEDGTTKGFTRKAEDGIVTWKLSLAPGEKRELQLAFHVAVPKDYATGF